MNCLEFRRAAGADPEHLSPEALAHRDACPQCAQFLREIQHLDATIFKALKIPIEPRAAARQAPPPRVADAVRASLANRSRWYALAASVAGGVAIGALLWAGGSRDALAKDAVEHMKHETASMVATTTPADPAAVHAALEADGVNLKPDVGVVSYVMACQFRGHTVPHLVVQTSTGPVTVLVLRDEKVSRTTKFHEQGFAGTLVHSGPGGLAIIGTSDAQVAEAAAKVQSALEWK
jgi:hypothetical protein